MAVMVPHPQWSIGHLITDPRKSGGDEELFLLAEHKQETGTSLTL